MGRSRGLKLNPQQLQKCHVVAAGHLVEPQQHLIRQPRKQLNHRHARIRGVVVGPLWAVARDAKQAFVHQILEACDRRDPIWVAESENQNPQHCLTVEPL